MPLPFAPIHVQLITACYPPSAALLNSGPDYRPNAQELSRLTYYAANRPGKINKLGNEIEKRIRSECRKAQAGNARSRASLLISLSILRALITECRRDVSLLTPSLLAAVDVTLEGFSSDLEVSAKVASSFTAWTTHTDGRLIGVDNDVTKDYMSILSKFSQMSIASSKTSDKEFRNRTRLVGLAALTGAVTSEALYSSTYFVLRSAALKEKPTSPYMAEFRTRPPSERRAASIHLHVDGDKGPSMADVSQTCLRALSSLFGHSNGLQATHIMQAILDSLEKWGSWERLDHCRWFARKATDWTQYQYRYAVPTRLVERLQEDQDAPVTTPLHNALAAMLTTVFTSPTPLINLSTSDIISVLITLVIRRAAINPNDSLLPALTECIASVGTHVYYADQISDLANELISRLMSVETVGVSSRDQETSENGRSQALRALLSGLVGLIRAPKASKEQDQTGEVSFMKATALPSPSSGQIVEKAFRNDDPNTRPLLRTKVSPELWQETLTLLCDENYGVRADCANALIFYLSTEISRRGEHRDVDGVRRIRPLVEGPVRQGANLVAMLYGDAPTRFLNAVHVYLYILATSTVLNARTSSSSPARSTNGEEGPAVNIIPATPMESRIAIGASENQDSPSQHGRRSISSQVRIRKQSTVQRLLLHVPSQLASTVSSSATGSDYRNILSVLTAVYENLPVRGLLTGVPFLLALDAMTRIGEVKDPATVGRLWAIREILARIWLVLGKVWDCAELTEMTKKALKTIPSSSFLPPATARPPGVFAAAEEPVAVTPAEGTQAQWQGVDALAAIATLASNENALHATGSADIQALHSRISTHWTPENALKDSVEPQPQYDALRGEGASPRLKIAPALMHIENMSLQSLNRSARGVGVTDLRDALEGRSSMSNPALVNNKPPSISTLEHASVANGDIQLHRLAPTRSRPEKPIRTGSPGEVRDVLNKLRIGKQAGGSNLLKSSFPALQRPGMRPPLLPPYKS
ncbi:hypothetical protein EW146_g5089 [Bondarzewia mesenterica]|uniref:Protein EFR3 n=1 Tax=Bondarzewia mesenterica TaxID=1095465 RepID=A0A4S4LSK8_9AGAM|nr:hypothetical protein EW146_g5089 [Bondarzewia mesenterica]